VHRIFLRGRGEKPVQNPLPPDSGGVKSLNHQRGRKGRNGLGFGRSQVLRIHKGLAIALHNGTKAEHHADFRFTYMGPVRYTLIMKSTGQAA
jgi:hypothetical protein